MSWSLQRSRGLSADFLKTFRRVKKDDGSACGQALRLRKTVIIRDVENDPEFSAFRPDAKKAGFRSVQSTPFITKDGNVLGMVSTHFAHAHEPTPIEMQTLKQYSMVAAEHLHKMLGDVPLATKAAQMSEELYSQALGDNGVNARLRTHKKDSIVSRFVIHGLRQETHNESRLLLANEGSVCAA